MKKINIIFLLLFVNNVMSQTLSIEVDYISKSTTEQNEEFLFYHRLIDNGEISLYRIVDTVANYSSQTNRLKKDMGLYIDKVNSTIHYYNPIMNKDFYVKETEFESKLDWIFTEETKKIMDLDCKSAKLTFRGREYTAFYTEKILFNSGPYKFFGLPGLILEVFSTDERFHFVANKIKLKKEDIRLINPYSELKDSDFITFKMYKDIFSKKLQDMQKKAQSEEKEDVEYKFTDNSIELKD
jgi:GLPGLI family protein